MREQQALAAKSRCQRLFSPSIVQLRTGAVDHARDAQRQGPLAAARAHPDGDAARREPIILDASREHFEAPGLDQRGQRAAHFGSDAVAMDVPERADMPQKAPALRVAQVSPKPLRGGAQRVDDGAPILSAAGSQSGAAAHVVQQSAWSTIVNPVPTRRTASFLPTASSAPGVQGSRM